MYVSYKAIVYRMVRKFSLYFCVIKRQFIRPSNMARVTTKALYSVGIQSSSIMAKLMLSVLRHSYGSVPFRGDFSDTNAQLARLHSRQKVAYE